MLNSFKSSYHRKSLINQNSDSNSNISEKDCVDEFNRASNSNVDNYFDCDEDAKLDHFYPFWRNDMVSCLSPMKSYYRITFEIIKAKAITAPINNSLNSFLSFSSNLSSNSSPKKKYVLYTVLIKRSPGLESQPGVLERRYSQFLILYSSLKKKFRNLLTHFPFPKKSLTKNFDIKVIRERSIAFENLLIYCLSVTDLLRTSEFVEFLHNPEMREVKKLLKTGNFEDAANILENAYFIEEKIFIHEGFPNHQGFTILTLLIALLNATNNLSEAYSFGLKMKEIIMNFDCFDHSELMVPLLILLIHIFWSNEKDKSCFEQRLNRFKQNGIKIEGQPALLELILKKDFTQLTSKS